MDGSDAVRALHDATRHGARPARPEQLLPFRPLDPRNQPAPFKRYEGVEPEDLPRELRQSSSPAVEVLSGQGPDRRPASSPLDRDLLGTLLFLTGGVTRYAPGDIGDRIWFRTAMSAGNRHPVEIYVVERDVHHYDPLRHALVPLRRGVDVGSTTLVLTGIPFRTCWKYGERGWRHLWWDAGAMVANLLAAAEAHGVAVRVLVGFADADVAALVGVDRVDEVPLALVVLGDGEPALPAATSLEPLSAPAEPVAPQVLRFPLVTEAQDRTVLEAESVAAWRAAASGVARSAPDRVGLPSDGGRERDDRVEDVVLRRGSTRRFCPEAGPPALLGWALPAAARAVPLDAAAGGTLLEHLVNLHEVAPDTPVAEPGACRYTPAEGFTDHLPSTDARSDGTHLCLDQPLGGDSCYTVFHAASLDGLLGALGGRGYRAAQLEAGIVAGRLALAAVALGAGATGLTFYDGAVSSHFATELAPMLATAVGLPATAPAPSGRPGDPVELGGFARLQLRPTRRRPGRPG